MITSPPPPSRRSLAFWANLALDFVFPRRCVGCGAWDTFMCSLCAAGLHRMAPPFCAGCGDELTLADDRIVGVCRPCRMMPPTFLNGARSAYRFGGAIREALHALKYDGVSALAGPLGADLAEVLSYAPWRTDLLVPAPLHSQRQRERGYNQAEKLAQAASAITGAKVDARSLRRTRATVTQTALKDTERRANVRGAFAWTGPELEGRTVTLVDDVMTTGATLDACAAALRAAGAGAVYAVTVARA
ncbi:MAG: ComF family protein [Chloroflexi bacterium]|nr:ComF family protein [Chloroflexota bacterium]